MITELIMLFVSAILFYCAVKIARSAKPILKQPERFLVYYLMGCGIAIFLYMMRMFLVWHGPVPDVVGASLPDQWSVPILCYKLGGAFHIFGMLSAMVFAGLLFTRRGEKFWRIILLVLFVSLLAVFMPAELLCDRIMIEPYEIFVSARTEYLLAGAGFAQFAMLIPLLLFILIPVLGFAVHGFRTKGGERTKSLLFSLGFLVMIVAAILDGLAPWPALLFLWRILYGVSGVITYSAFKIKI
ncbi:MAG: hypothetical protein MOIL_01639 [Candidatus Methanolliviera sp. GoM_oil]|nr:MAG: hypothetical protein MOIL_01639 [Candidatus Methanolliviera sp. GoM_oil]